MVMRPVAKENNGSRRIRVLAVVVGLLALSGALAPGPGGAVAAGAPRPLYWGAQIGTQLTGAAAPWDMGPVYTFQQMAGKGLSLVEFSAPFSDCRGGRCVFIPFPSTPLENARRYGAIPVFSWNSGSTVGGVDQPRFSLSKIIHGAFDRQLRKFASSAKEWGHPFFLRFDWEMNGFWFPWSEGVNGNRQGQFVAAWRHVHRIFTEEGATNASWVWCPNVNISGQLRSLHSLYPGNAYVDWTCLDGYNWGARRGSPGWLSFDQIYHSTYKKIVRKIAPGKPMLLAELASTDRGGSKPAWIRDTLRQIRDRYHKVRGVIWFDQEERNTHWPIESSPAATEAFRQGIADPSFQSNTYAELAESPIQPPSGF
jgi:hypothetical protein